MRGIQLFLCKIILLAFFMAIAMNSKAQSKVKFPSDSIGFFEKMESYLTDARKEGKDFMKQFKAVWYGGYFSEKQREGVYEITNKMSEKSYRPFPDFRNYLYTVGSFVTDKDQTEESFVAWKNTLSKLLDDRRKKNFTQFLDFSNYLFRENAIYYSASNTWTSSNSNYIFGYDSLPKITFEALDLICFSRDDSMKIKNTQGVYYPTEGLWIGKGGLVDWEGAGLLADEVYAKIGKYTIEVKYNHYEIDSVEFHNSFYLNKPLIGKLEDKLLANMTPLTTSYPRFDSYDQQIRIENIFPNVNYDGGFSMRGAKLLGTGTGKNLAKVEFIREDTLFLRALSESFSIRTDRIVSTEAAVRFYLKNDSISQPGLNFKFLPNDKLVTLYRNNEGVARTPYTDSYHQMEMSFEVLNWKTDEPMLDFTNLVGGTKTTAYFSSTDFFKEEIFEKIGGLDQDNPLYQINKMVGEFGKTTLPVKDLGYYLKMSPTATQNLIVSFTGMGFLTFDFDQNEFTVQDKLFDFVKSMRRKIDYDVLTIYSDVSSGALNGRINLLNYDLTINGIPSIVVSDSQQVRLMPTDGKIVMHKNRSFDFAGRVKAGRFDFYGKSFAFDYQNFNIDLINVDSMQLKAPTGERDEMGRPILKRVRSVIQDMNGKLLIDNFANKSGLKNFPKYPILQSNQDSYVYYDKKETFNGVYDKSRFYFQIDPFTIDSLDNFNNEQLSFNGTLTSANIFPDMEENLTLQEDFSLGFKKKTPESGFPTYGGKGQFFDDIQLSNLGLRGNGKLEYITSTTYSSDFIFFPDSMRTLAEKYLIAEQKEGPEYPNVKAEQTKMLWLPYQDVMYATTTTKGMEMYDKVSDFEGTTAYTPQRLKGDGTYHFENADLKSNQLMFGYMSYDADTASFNLKSLTEDAFTLKTENVNAHVDFKKRFAQFKANGKFTPIEFPINQYICFMEEFKWYMDNDVIELTSSSAKQVSADVKLEGSKFVSTKKDQDSLFFYSPKAKYDSRKNIITAEEVLYINAADARVYPDSGMVTVLKAAEMKPLLKSKIIANSVTEYHNIYNANANILGRKDYTASGYVDYKDRTGKVETIYFQNITVDTTGQTTASGEIPDSIGFSLSPQFAFSGKVLLMANNQFLVFEGLTRLSHDCKKLDRPWFSFKAEVDPEDIYIPIDTGMRSPTGAFVASSMNLRTDSTYFYSGFLSKRQNYSDINVLPAYGYLHYDTKDNKYIISTKEKIKEISLPGNYLSLDLNACKVYGEGLVNIGTNSGNLAFKAAGNINHSQVDNGIVLDLMMSLNFFFDDNLIEMIADNINENINLQPTDALRPTFEKGLKEMIGVEKGDELISQLSLNGKMKRMPDQLKKNFVFNDLKMKWNQNLGAYISFGKIGISNLNKEEVNKYVEGMLVITKQRGGDRVDLLIEVSPQDWYYFNYRRNLLKVVSNNELFNTKIKEMKRDDRKYKNKKGEDPFTYMIGIDREKERFKNEFKTE